MANDLFNPDPAQQLPLLALLPRLGEVTQIQSSAAVFAARLEHLAALPAATEREDGRRRAAEEVMLRQVLEWVRSQGES